MFQFVMEIIWKKHIQVERDVLELNHVRHLPPHRPATQAITAEGDPYQAAVVRAALS